MRKTIGGKCFELCKGEYISESRYCTLYDAYKKPSVTKCCFWEDWCDWFYSNSERFNYTEDGIEYDYISISRKSTTFFTINGQITIDGITYTFLITPKHNKLFYYIV